MRAVVQRVKNARVTVDDEVTGEIGAGLLVLLGISGSDGEEQCRYVCDKVANLRIFEDPNGKMNLSLISQGFSMLVVSQFTLYGDCRKGRRPSFIDAAPPELAEPLYLRFVEMARTLGIPTATGRFGAMMDVELVNWGPVTLIVDSI